MFKKNLEKVGKKIGKKYCETIILVKMYNEIFCWNLVIYHTTLECIWEIHIHSNVSINFYLKRNNFSTNVNTDNCIYNESFAFAYELR